MSDKKKEIADLLLEGHSIEHIKKKTKCHQKTINSVLGSENFALHCMQVIENKVKISSLNAMKNILEIANNPKAAPATRLKANQFIVEKALDFKDLGGNLDAPSNMSQAALEKRMKELQDESNKRNNVIEHTPKELEKPVELSDML